MSATPADNHAGARARGAMPEVVYTPESPIRHPGRLLRAMGRDILASRELAWRLFIRDVSAMYRQSLLGYFWAFVPPLLAAAPWVLLNSQNVVNIASTEIPYPVFVLSGMMLWQSFLDALNSPLKQSNAARSMLSKINFPREALILAGLADAAWNLAIRMALLLPLLWFYSGARLSEANIRQPDEVLQALQSGNRPGAAALWSRLSDETRARLSGPGETASMEDRRAALRDALNGLISGPSLYEAQAFEGVALSSTTRQRLSAGAGSGKAERLNRLLIEDIFPGEIARNRLFSRPPLHALIWAPVGIAALLLLGVSIGLLITPVGLLYTDVSRGIGIIAGFGMLLTPVVYPPRTSGLVGWLTTWNPISPVLVTARDWLTGQEAAFTSGFWAVSAVAAATFIVAWFMYRLTMPLIVERMGG